MTTCVDDCGNLHSYWFDAIVDAARKRGKECLANSVSDHTVHSRIGSNSIKRVVNRSNEAGTQLLANPLVVMERLAHVLLGFRTQSDGECHQSNSASNSAFTCSQGIPPSGSASASASRRSISAQWAASMSGSICSKARLSQIASAMAARSWGGSRSIPSSVSVVSVHCEVRRRSYCITPCRRSSTIAATRHVPTASILFICACASLATLIGYGITAFSRANPRSPVPTAFRCPDSHRLRQYAVRVRRFAHSSDQCRHPNGSGSPRSLLQVLPVLQEERGQLRVLRVSAWSTPLSFLSKFLQKNSTGSFRIASTTATTRHAPVFRIPYLRPYLNVAFPALRRRFPPAGMPTGQTRLIASVSRARRHDRHDGIPFAIGV